MGKWSLGCLLTAALSGAVSATTIHVPADQPTIQAGINAAVNGDTVLVAPGTYTDNLLVSGKTVHVIGSAGSDSTFFHWNGVGEHAIEFASGGTLSGFTWQNQSMVILNAIWVVGGQSAVTRNVFKNLTMGNDLIVGLGTGTCEVSRNTFISVYGDFVVAFIEQMVPAILNNTISGADRGIGGFVDGTIVKNNIIANCREYGFHNSDNVASENYNCYWANHLNRYDDPLDPTDLQADPQFLDTSASDYGLQLTSPCIDRGDPNSIYNDPDGSRNDIGAVTLSFPRVVQVVLGEGESNSHIISGNPNIHWMSNPDSTRVGFEIQVGSDSNWVVAEMWDTGPVESSDSVAVYAGAPLVDGHTYYLRLRVTDGLHFSPWYYANFRMNSPPTIPALNTPSDGTISLNPPVLVIQNSVDSENDGLTYVFEVYMDSALTSIVDSSPQVQGGPIMTTWVGNSHSENSPYWWRARAFDAFEYSGWSTSHMFWINGVQEPPLAPMLLSPPDSAGTPIFDFRPTLKWSTSIDPDPLDSVHYRVDLSLNSIFQPPASYDDVLCDSLLLPDSLVYGTRYWWRVRAFDKTGLYATSTPSKSFWTWQLGDLDNSHNCDIADLSRLIDYLYISFNPIVPLKIADLDSDCHVDISDLSRLIDRLYISFAPLGVGCE